MNRATLIGVLSLIPALASGEVELLTQPSDSPLITIRILFQTGAAYDPDGKEGAASLTASMLAEGGTQSASYAEIVERLFPIAAQVHSQVDKETTVFYGTTHIDKLETYYETLRSMLLEPGWQQEDFSRLKDDALNLLRIELRSNNEEELGKEHLYLSVYGDHPYGHHNSGTAASLAALTIEDLKQFYATNYRHGNLIIGLSGGYPEGFPERVVKDFSALPEGTPDALQLPAPTPAEKVRVRIIEKETRSTLISLGFPLEVTRSDPDWPALKLVQSYFGQHRTSKSYLYQRIREIRGMNYGDYAYIEYFPHGMFQFQPDPNLVRRQQIFQIWIRPVVPENGLFALKIALYELDKLVREGLSQADFDSTRLYLSKFVNLLTQTQSAELGYALDSRLYGIGEFNSFMKDGLAKLTRESVNEAIKRHLRSTNLDVTIITADAGGFARQLRSPASTKIQYASPPPQEILDEDPVIGAYRIDLGDVQVVPVDTVFED